MNRHEAYRLLAETLETYRSRPFPELLSMIGARRSDRVRTQAGGEYLRDVTAVLADAEGRKIRIAVTIDSPSTFRLERIEGAVVVEEGAQP